MPKCCVSGHRPHRFPWNYRDSECKEHQKYLRTMAVSVKKLIDEGYDCFISGGAIGVDTDFAEAVLQAKADFAPWIALELALPRTRQILALLGQTAHTQTSVRSGIFSDSFYISSYISSLILVSFAA